MHYLENHKEAHITHFLVVPGVPTGHQTALIALVDHQTNKSLVTLIAAQAGHRTSHAHSADRIVAL